METLRLIAFGRPPGLVAAIRNGYLEAEGLQIDYTQTRGSVEQIRGLLAGKWDLAHTAVDNVLAYVDAENADLFVFLVGDMGTNQKVIVRPEIKSLSDLRGKTLGLDALTTGYAFMLYKMLELNGVGRQDYKTVSVGGTAERTEAIIKGEIDAALLSPPHDQRALAAGCHVLTPASAYFPGYPGLTAATRRTWAADHHDVLVGYTRALLKGVRWAADPTNKATVVQQLADDHGRDTPAAERLYQLEVGDREKSNPSVEEVRQAVQRVGTLRREMTAESGAAQDAFDMDRYFDASFMLEADPSLARAAG